MGIQKALMTDIRIRINEEISLEMMEIYLTEKDITREDVTFSRSGVIQLVTWIEKGGKKSSWGGTCPKVTVAYDDEHAYLLDVYVQYSKHEGKLTAKEIRERIMSELTESRVLPEREDEEGDEEDDE